jgi:hypothetical protein
MEVENVSACGRSVGEKSRADSANGLRKLDKMRLISLRGSPLLGNASDDTKKFKEKKQLVPGEEFVLLKWLGGVL